MILSDSDLLWGATHRELSIVPWRKEHVQPASYDLTLGAGLLRYRPELGADEIYDPLSSNQSNLLEECPLVEDYDLLPGEFLLGTTEETVTLGSEVAGSVMGKSSLGRAGLIVHATAGFIDPGFKGQITLEITNLSPVSIRLTEGMLIAQVAFTWLKSPTRLPYGHPGRLLKSKYQYQSGVQASKGVTHA